MIIPSDENATRRALDALRELSRTTQAELKIDYLPLQTKQIDGVSFDEFRGALNTPNQFDANLGGVRLSSRDRRVSLRLEWARDANAPRSDLHGTVHEEWLDCPQHVDALTEFMESFAHAAKTEYALANHVSDEARKLPVGFRYEGRPGAGIPYVPWLLVLGPAYVKIIGRAALQGLGADTVRVVNDVVSVRTSKSPLLYGTPVVAEREQVVRDRLGASLFVDSREPLENLIRPEYAVQYVTGAPASGIVVDAYAKDNRIVTVAKRDQ